MPDLSPALECVAHLSDTHVHPLCYTLPAAILVSVRGSSRCAQYARRRQYFIRDAPRVIHRLLILFMMTSLVLLLVRFGCTDGGVGGRCYCLCTHTHALRMFCEGC